MWVFSVSKIQSFFCIIKEKVFCATPTIIFLQNRLKVGLNVCLQIPKVTAIKKDMIKMNKQINLQKTVPMMRHALKKICEVSSNSGRVLFSFFRSVFQSFKLVKKYRPKKVICFGGYATLPILFISVLLGKKTQRLLCLFLLMHFFFPLLFLYGKYTLKEKI